MEASTILAAVSAADGGREDDDASAAATIILVADLEGGGFNVEINRLTAIRVPAGTKNSCPVGFLLKE